MTLDITFDHEKEAWDALIQARRFTGRVVLEDGKPRRTQEWEDRGAPSPGARARAILRALLFPPSYIARCEAAVALYVSESQNAERGGVHRPRRAFDLNGGQA